MLYFCCIRATVENLIFFFLDEFDKDSISCFFLNDVKNMEKYQKKNENSLIPIVLCVCQ